MLSPRFRPLALSLSFTLAAVAGVRLCLAQRTVSPNKEKPAATATKGDKAADKEPDADAEPSIWMKQKLRYTQNILEGMARGDFKTIAKNAQSMKFLNRIEGFVRQRPEGYRSQLQTFQDALNRIDRMARAENLDGVTLAFHQLTLSCVQCHRELREGESTAKKEPKSDASR